MFKRALPLLSLITTTLLPMLAQAQQITLSTVDLSGVSVTATSSPLRVQTSDFVSAMTVQYPPSCELASAATSVTKVGSLMVLDLDFFEGGDGVPCEAVVTVPASLPVTMEVINDNGFFLGGAASLVASSSNGSLTISNTGATPITASAGNGTLFVVDTHGPLALKSINGDVVIQNGSGSFNVTGANNDVTVRQFIFDPQSKNSIKNINGVVSTSKLSTLNTKREKRGLKVRARAFSTIKFPREKRFSSFPGMRWYTRTLIKGKKSASLTLDVSNVLEMK